MCLTRFYVLFGVLLLLRLAYEASLAGPDFMDDPFIPQRGRRAKNQQYDDPFFPMRGRRADNLYDDPFYPMRGRRADKNSGYDDPFIPMRGRKSDIDDPFYPMRGRRADKNSLYDDPFYPMRGKRADKLYDDPFYPMRGRRADKNPVYDDPFYPMRGRRADSLYDDPFYPMRGRRADKNPVFDDPFIPMRGRRSSKQDAESNKRSKQQQQWDDPFIPMRGRRSKNTGYDDPFFPMRGRRDKNFAYDDPFFPMRGRRADEFDDPFFPMRGKRSTQQQTNKASRKKRGLIASSDAFEAVYAPTEEVIVKLNPNGMYKSKNAHKPTAQSRPSQTNKWFANGINPKDSDKHSKQKSQLIESHANVPSLSSKNLGYNGFKATAETPKQQQPKKSFFVPKDFSASDNAVIDDYSSELYVDPAYPFDVFNKNRMTENSRRMKSSTDLSQENRDTDYLARGSRTPFLF